MKYLLLALCCIFVAATHAASGNIRLATTEWAPYYSQSLPLQGPLSDISRQALAALGYELTVDFMPWKRAMLRAEAGRYDGVLGAYDSKERAEKFWVSEPIGISELVIFVRKNSSIEYQTMHSLAGYRSCTLYSYFYGEAFEQSNEIIKFESNSMSQCFELLLAGRVDVVFADKRVGQAELASNPQLEQNSVAILDTPISITTLHVLWTKSLPKNKQLKQAFDEQLKLLRAQGKLDLAWQQSEK